MDIRIEDGTIKSIDGANNCIFVRFVYRIGLLLLLILSISIYLLNVVTDVALAFVYYRSGDYTESMVTLALVIFPTIITSLLSNTDCEFKLFCSNPSSDKITEETGLLKKLQQESDDEKSESSLSYFVFRLIGSILLLGPILWCIDSFRSNIKEGRLSLNKNKKIKYSSEDNRTIAEKHAKSYQLILAFVYTSPQLVFQLSRMIKQNTFDLDMQSMQMQIISAATSLVSIALNVTIAYPINQNAFISIFLFLGQLLMIGGRVSILILFTSVYGWMPIFILALIKTTITIIAMWKSFDYKDVLCFIILGYSQLFVSFPLNKRHFINPESAFINGVLLYLILTNFQENLFLWIASLSCCRDYQSCFHLHILFEHHKVISDAMLPINVAGSILVVFSLFCDNILK